MRSDGTGDSLHTQSFHREEVTGGLEDCVSMAWCIFSARAHSRSGIDQMIVNRIFDSYPLGQQSEPMGVSSDGSK